LTAPKYQNRQPAWQCEHANTRQLQVNFLCWPVCLWRMRSLQSQSYDESGDVPLVM
jgi:hypothetical protein